MEFCSFRGWVLRQSYEAHTGLKLVILFSQLPKFWDYHMSCQSSLDDKSIDYCSTSGDQESFFAIL